MENLPKDILGMLKEYISPNITMSHELSEKGMTYEELDKIGKSRGPNGDIYRSTFIVETLGLRQVFNYRYSFVSYETGYNKNLSNTIEKIKARGNTHFSMESNVDFPIYQNHRDMHHNDTKYCTSSIEFSSEVLEKFLIFLQDILNSVPKGQYLNAPSYNDWDDNYR